VLKCISLILALSLILVSAEETDAQTGKIYRIGYLDSSARAVNDPALNALQKGLSDLGWVEGTNITFVYRFAEGKGPAYEAELAGELWYDSKSISSWPREARLDARRTPQIRSLLS
jgi:hypothetical protein